MSEQGIKKRRAIKGQMVESMGGKCVCCGYDRCDGALAFHHLNEEEKEIEFGAISTYMAPWKRITKELRKCVLLCHNCHRLTHLKIVEIPHEAPGFNEEFADKGIPMEPCEQCERPKPINESTICRACSNKNRGKNEIVAM
jgi:hypothetical protein